MAQLTFFDAHKRLAALSKQGDPLEAIARLVPWEEFRAEIEAVVLTAEIDKKSTAGRKSIDALVMFRMLVLQSLYNLSDAQAEYQARDRLSFTRFLALGIEDRIADGTTLWLFSREAGEGRFDRKAVCTIRPASGGQGLYRAGRSDGGRDHRAGAQAAQLRRGQ